MSEITPPRTAHASVDLACFELAGQTYAVPIARVREILMTPRLTPLPDAPAIIEGLIDLRGTLIPVVDLERLLNRDGAPSSARNRTVVVEVRGLVVGFRVERATQVVAATADSIETIPALMREAGCAVVGAVVRRKDRPPILVLELEVLIEGVLASGKGTPARSEVAA